MRDNVEIQVSEILEEILEFESGGIKIENTFEELEIDSILFIRIVVTCETKLNMTFEDEMLLMSKFPDVSTYIDYVKSRCTFEE